MFLILASIASHLLMTRCASKQNRRKSYYRVIPIIYWPLGSALAIMHLWMQTEDDSCTIKSQRNYFLSAIRGKEPLWVVIVGVLIPALVIIQVSASTTSGSNQLIPNLGISIIALLASLAANISLWRCAPNTDEKFKTWLTRIYVIANLIFALYKLYAYVNA